MVATDPMTNQTANCLASAVAMASPPSAAAATPVAITKGARGQVRLGATTSRNRSAAEMSRALASGHREKVSAVSTPNPAAVARAAGNMPRAGSHLQQV